MTCEGAIIVFLCGVIAFGSSSLGNNVFLNMFFFFFSWGGGVYLWRILFTSLHFLHSGISQRNGVRPSITLQ